MCKRAQGREGESFRNLIVPQHNRCRISCGNVWMCCDFPNIWEVDSDIISFTVTNGKIVEFQIFHFARAHCVFYCAACELI